MKRTRLPLIPIVFASSLTLLAACGSRASLDAGSASATADDPAPSPGQTDPPQAGDPIGADKLELGKMPIELTRLDRSEVAFGGNLRLEPLASGNGEVDPTVILANAQSGAPFAPLTLWLAGSPKRIELFLATAQRLDAGTGDPKIGEVQPAKPEPVWLLKVSGFQWAGVSAGPPPDDQGKTSASLPGPSPTDGYLAFGAYSGEYLWGVSSHPG